MSNIQYQMDAWQRMRGEEQNFRSEESELRSQENFSSDLSAPSCNKRHDSEI